MVRLSYDQRTRGDMARRLSEGKTKPEVLRCIKRYIAREVFNALRAGQALRRVAPRVGAPPARPHLEAFWASSDSWSRRSRPASTSRVRGAVS